MQRDQRVYDNWALLHAQQLAKQNNECLIVVFCLLPTFSNATIRQYEFMLKGLEQLEITLQSLNIPFHILTGDPGLELPKFIAKNNISELVTDFNPLRSVVEWKDSLSQNINIPFHEVDAHNIVPCWIASPKLEYAAYTIRPKINKLLPEYMDEFFKVEKQKEILPAAKNDWGKLRKSLKVNTDVEEVTWLKPGEEAAHNALESFVNQKLEVYYTDRNDPNLDALSNLSPYLHFGQISAQRIALAVEPLSEYLESKKSFLEELIIRRELSDNFCYYNPHYDSFEGVHHWSKKTLNEHRDDQREFTYSLDQFESATTHDPLWNAAQVEMKTTGKMHGFMRMYWAKKILEWSKSPEDAFAIAIHLNDKYELDGRDPNGYAGIAWSIGGIHDRAWTERPVFGKIRYMNYNGCMRKFDVKRYIRKHLQNEQGRLNL